MGIEFIKNNNVKCCYYNVFNKGAYLGDSKSQNYFIEVLPLDVSAYSKRFGVSSDGLMEVEKTISTTVVKASKQEAGKKGECPNCDKDITAEDLKTIFPDADVTKRQNVANTYNKYMKELNMNTCWNKAHLFCTGNGGGWKRFKLKRRTRF